MKPLEAIERVHAALTGLARALETGQPDQVLEAEQPLAEAAGALATFDRAALTDPVHLRARLLETRLALARCRALGDTSAGLIGAMYPAETSYGPTGHRRLRTAPSPTVNSQV
jgi:hypothetical protein